MDYKKQLQSMIEAIVSGKEDEAKAAFHAYSVARTSGMVNEAPFAPEAKADGPTNQAEPSEQDDTAGSAHIFDRDGRTLAIISSDKAEKAIRTINRETEIRRLEFEELMNYMDGNADIHGPDKQKMHAFLSSLDGVACSIYQVDHGGYGTAVPADAQIVVIIPKAVEHTPPKPSRPTL